MPSAWSSPILCSRNIGSRGGLSGAREEDRCWARKPAAKHSKHRDRHAVHFMFGRIERLPRLRKLPGKERLARPEVGRRRSIRPRLALSAATWAAKVL